MLVLTNADVTALLGSLTSTQVVSCLTTLAETLQSTSSGSPVVQPSRQVVTTPSGATTLLMPTFTPDSSSVKIVTLDTRPSPSPSSTANTALTGSLLLFTPSGTLDAVLNASEVTAFRTALASMIPYVLRFLPSLLPPPNTYSSSTPNQSPPPPTASEIVIFGAGMQAEWALKLLLLLTAHSSLPLPTQITLLNRTLPRAQSLTTRISEWLKTALPDLDPSKLPILTPDVFTTENLTSLIQSSDAIFCCTPSHTPLFPASTLLTPTSSLLKTRFFSAVGSYTPSMQELDPHLLLPNKGGITLVIADTVEGVNIEAGEVIRASNLLKQSGNELHIHELGTLLGKMYQRKWQEAVRTENVLYKSVGMGIMDLAIGRELVGLARVEGSKLGVEVEGF